MSVYPWITAQGDLMGDVDLNYKDYEINMAKGYATGHKINGIKSIEAWASRCLSVIRYKYPIYSWDYGISLEEYIGNSYTKELIDSELSRDIKETLMIHPSIKDVTNFVITSEGEILRVSCRISTMYGGVDVAI